ncbi:hypothetical protein [Chlamydia abortus]|uniref:hypothetical protein n=1 Tax=Chlamydia abortus TaxID=83555 RepID=UPI003F68B6B8
MRLQVDCAEGVGGPSQENTPLQHRVITQQPGKQVSLDVQVGDASLVETIQKAGAIAASVLNAPQTQRGASYCHKHCSPWCDSHCPNWLSHCFQCLCTCIINPPEEPSGANRDLLDFLGSMKQKHGPIVLGLGMEKSGIDWTALLSEGLTLTGEQKEDFDRLCIEAKKLLKKLLAGGIQQDLFDLANDPNKVPEVNDVDTMMAKRGYGNSAVTNAIHLHHVGLSITRGKLRESLQDHYKVKYIMLNTSIISNCALSSTILPWWI